MFFEFCAIFDRYVPGPLQLKVAKAILETQDIHEESWSDEKRGYLLDHYESANRAVDIHFDDELADCKKFWAYIIGGANIEAWNDIQILAFTILKHHGITSWKGFNPYEQQTLDAISDQPAEIPKETKKENDNDK
jgi:hypothetical protein